MKDKVFCWKDKGTWPADWPGIDIDPAGDEAQELAHRLDREYDRFVAYHACRPVDVSTYYKDGLCIARHSDLLNMALEIFVGDQFPEVTKNDVVAAAEQKPATDNGKLYVALDDRILIHQSSHYLLYGSEYLACVAARLQDQHGRNYLKYLGSRGRPTVFEMELPFGWIPQGHRQSLAAELSWAVLHDNVAHHLDFTVTLQRSVGPGFIKSHSHPANIRDPLHRSTQHEGD